MALTSAKTKKKAIEEKIGEWMKANDKELWANEIKVKAAAILVSKELQLQKPIGYSVLKRLATDHCVFWLSEEWKKHRSPTMNMLLTSEEWDNIANAINKNRDILLGESVQFAVRLLRFRNVPANKSVVSGSMAWIKLQREQKEAG